MSTETITNITCDRCGVNNKEKLATFKKRYILDLPIGADSYCNAKACDYDLCDECYVELWAWFWKKRQDKATKENK